MNKAQFVELVQANGDYKTKIEAEVAIIAFTESVTKALSQNEDVSLVGFGSFTAILQKGKSGKVPGTDKTYTTEDKIVPKFRASKAFKDSVAQSNKV